MVTTQRIKTLIQRHIVTANEMLRSIERIQAYNVIVVLVLIYVCDASANVLGNDQILNAIDPAQNASAKRVPFIEYYIEHNVSQADAKRSFFEVGVKLIDDKPSSWCMTCSDQIINYCLSGKMLDDHCCCDSRHGKEQIPWIPHSCYVGERCHPSIGSCINYTEIRECCCDRVLAKRWKTIYSCSVMTTANVFAQLVCALVLITRSLNCL